LYKKKFNLAKYNCNKYMITPSCEVDWVGDTEQAILKIAGYHFPLSNTMMDAICKGGVKLVNDYREIGFVNGVYLFVIDSQGNFIGNEQLKDIFDKQDILDNSEHLKSFHFKRDGISCIEKFDDSPWDDAIINMITIGNMLLVPKKELEDNNDVNLI
jgi:hypothetical protein